MADPHHHHHDPIQDNIDAHPVKLAIGVVIGAFALIVGIYLLVQLAVHGYASRSQKDDPTMSDAAVKKRIAPVGQLSVDPNAPAAPAPAAAATVVVAAPHPTFTAARTGPSGDTKRPDCRCREAASWR